MFFECSREKGENIKISGALTCAASLCSEIGAVFCNSFATTAVAAVPTAFVGAGGFALALICVVTGACIEESARAKEEKQSLVMK